MKTCGNCKESKPLSDFYKNKACAGGLDTTCKACFKARAKAYRLAKPGQTKAVAAAWREPRRAALAAAAREYYAKNAEHGRAVRREYYGANKAASRAKGRARKALEKRRVPVWADRAAILAIYKKAESLRALGLNVHVDHIYPLRGKVVSGLHVADNLQLLLAEDNLRKSNNLPS